MKNKIITFQYFQVVLQKEFNENDQIVWKTQKVFNFAEWLRKQKEEEKIKKNITVNNDFQGNLESIVNSESNSNIWFARFFKLRDIVPAKVKDGIGAESIELDQDKLFLKYIRRTIASGIISIFVSMTLFFRDMYEDNCLYDYAFYIWVGSLIYMLLCTYRSVSNMMELMFSEMS